MGESWLGLAKLFVLVSVNHGVFTSIGLRYEGINSVAFDFQSYLFFFVETTEMLWDSICLGNLWVKLGLVQSLILSPVGPVDPVEKNSIELQHVNEAVTSLLCY